jgi:hypothetical protein
VTTDDTRPPYVLRLTGEQIGSIDPPPEGDWFEDWDEYEDFVPARMLAAVEKRLRLASNWMHEYEKHGGSWENCSWQPCELDRAALEDKT